MYRNSTKTEFLILGLCLGVGALILKSLDRVCFVLEESLDLLNLEVLI